MDRQTSPKATIVHQSSLVHHNCHSTKNSLESCIPAVQSALPLGMPVAHTDLNTVRVGH